MSYTKIFSTLMKSANDALTGVTELNFGNDQVRWPNVDFTPPPTEPYATVDLLPASSEPVTLGQGGEDEHLGILQIGLYYPLQAGGGPIIESFDKLRTFFTAGVSLVHEGTEVSVLSCGVSPAANRDSRYVAYVSVYWRARTTRQ